MMRGQLAGRRRGPAELPKGSSGDGQRGSAVKRSAWVIVDHGAVNGVNFQNVRSTARSADSHGPIAIVSDNEVQPGSESAALNTNFLELVRSTQTSTILLYMLETEKENPGVNTPSLNDVSSIM
jgi:hypothetical protein